MDYEIESIDTVAKLDAALLQEYGLERRGALMAKRIMLDQASRATPHRPAANTGFTVVVPECLGISDVVDGDGRRFQVRVDIDGRRVVDMTPGTFMALLQGPHGKVWSDLQDAETWQKMQPGIHAN
jgi:hypothetical protein